MKTGAKRTVWVARFLTALVAVAFVPGSFMKVTRHPMVVEGFTRTGIPEGAIRILGIVELSCLVLFLVPKTTVLGTLLLTGFLGGATLANLINRSDMLHVFGVGLIVWAAAWLRVAQLRTLVPIRLPAASPGAEKDRPEPRREIVSQAESPRSTR